MSPKPRMRLVYSLEAVQVSYLTFRAVINGRDTGFAGTLREVCDFCNLTPIGTMSPW